MVEPWCSTTPARRPTESLGVIALGITHADRIEEAVRRALASAPDVADFFDDAAPERFFVKNLERVQGDERDAIILSIGYGKTPHGRVLHRFGPLNLEGGERRLNVAITRARRRMTVVSSFARRRPRPEPAEGPRRADAARLPRLRRVRRERPGGRGHPGAVRARRRRPRRSPAGRRPGTAAAAAAEPSTADATASPAEAAAMAPATRGGARDRGAATRRQRPRRLPIAAHAGSEPRGWRGAR